MNISLKIKTIAEAQRLFRLKRCWSKCYCCGDKWSKIKTEHVHMVIAPDKRNDSRLVCDDCAQIILFINSLKSNHMFLVGIFSRRDNSLFSSNSVEQNTLHQVYITDNIDKSHLVEARKDSDYQVINLSTKKFYNPDLNAWIPIETKVDETLLKSKP